MAVLAYLASARDGRRRDEVMALLWGEAPLARARQSVSQTVYVIRQTVAPDAVLDTGTGDLRLNARWLSSDVGRFLIASEDGRYEDALDLYKGDFLPAFHLADGTIELDDWIESERRHLRDLAFDAGRHLAEAAAAAERPDEAARWLTRAHALKPYDESIARQIVESLDAAGNRAGAVLFFRDFEARLARDLEMAPDESLQRLVAHIEARSEPAVHAARGSDSNIVTGDRPVSDRGTDRDHRLEPDIEPRAMIPLGPSLARRRRFLPAVLAFLAISLVTGWLYLSARPTTSTTPPEPQLVARRIAVAPFANHTGDDGLEGLGYVAADWVIQGLLEAGMGEVVSAGEVVRQFVAIAAAREDSANAGTSMEIALATRAGLLLDGQYYLASNDTVAFRANLIDVGSTRVLRVLNESRAPRTGYVNAIHELRASAVGSLGTYLNERMTQWSDFVSQPASPEAYRVYADGLDTFLRVVPGQEQLYADAARLFEQAASIDSTFNVPLIWAHFAHRNAGNSALGVEEILLSRAASLTPMERAMVDYVVAARTSEFGRAFAAAKQVLEYAPDSEWAYKVAYMGQFILRFTEGEAALRSVDPNRGWLRSWPSYWTVLADILHQQGKHHEEYDAYVRSGITDLLTEGRALVALGRIREAADAVQAAMFEQNDPLLWLSNGSRIVKELRLHGHDRAAVDLARSMVDWWRSSRAAGGPSEEDPEARIWFGSLVLEFDPEAAMAMLAPLTADEADGRLGANSATSFLGVAAARSGNVARADSILQWVESMLETTPRPAGIWFTKATIEAQLGRHDAALVSFKEATRLRDGTLWYGHHRPHFFSVAMQDYEPLELFARPR